MKYSSYNFPYDAHGLLFHKFTIDEVKDSLDFPDEFHFEDMYPGDEDLKSYTNALKFIHINRYGHWFEESQFGTFHAIVHVNEIETDSIEEVMMFVWEQMKDEI